MSKTNDNLKRKVRSHLAGKKLFNLAALTLAVCTTGLSQEQMNNWYIAPNQVNMTVTSPAPSTIFPVFGTNAAVTAGQVANGYYDNSGTGNLLFYVADANVYDYNNTLIGSFIGLIPFGGTEVAIVPFGDNDPVHCKNKYNIFCTAGGLSSHVGLYKTVLDMNSYSLSVPFQVDEILFGSEFGALAVGQKIAGGDRYLYFLAGSGFNGPSGQINKWIIKNDGSVIPPPAPYLNLYPNPVLGVNNPNAGREVFARELDLSPDGKWLAWASYEQSTLSPTIAKYHFIHLDGNGDFDLSIPLNGAYQQFNITTAINNYTDAGFRGVEFWQDLTFATTRLFMGAGTNGIYYNEIAIPFTNSPVIVTGSNGVGTATTTYGLSQIEKASNPYIYASSGNSAFNIGAFDPSNPLPQILTGNSFQLPTPPDASYFLPGNPPSNFYTLPDQIDGQNYSAITQPPITPVTTVNSYTFSSALATTWTYGTLFNNPWNATGPVQVIKELIIGTAATPSNLTISGMTFKFSPTAKVIIMSGSTLTLDNGAILTSDYILHPCDIGYTWIGVEVWGNSSASQNTVPLAVGRLTLQSGSRIEYAQWGARAQNPANTTQRGGIIEALGNSTFWNNKIDVEFLPYRNMVNGVQWANRSYFTSANFENDGFFTSAFTGAPQHVYISGCRGIRFTDCHTTNSTSQPMLNKQSIGIKSLNSNFTVSSNSTFNNLYHAIDAKRSSHNNNTSFSVYNSTFTNNQTGVYTDDINNFIMQQNTFNIGGNGSTQSWATTQLGLRNRFGSGFTIEENNFLKSSNFIATVARWGTAMYSTGSSANQIYKNTFMELTQGNHAEGINRSSSNAYFQGLQYLCNTNTGNADYDFYILSVDEIASDGIRLNQGTAAIPARNTFSTTNSGPANDINNNTGTAITYYYLPPNAPASYNNVIPLQVTSGSALCQVINPNCINRPLLNSEVLQLKSDFDAAETSYLSLLYTYNQLMDGGSTNALLNQMQQSWSNDAVVLYSQLLARSPYLSQDILREAANTNILPPAILFTICIANPDATRGEAFLKFLQYDLLNPLPQYMIDLIVASWDNGTARTSFENMLAGYNAQMSLTSSKIFADLYYKTSMDIDSIVPGDTNNYPQQINYWLNRIQTLTAKYDLIENYFEANEIEMAEAVLENIPVDFRLSADEQQSYNDYIYFYEFRKELFENESDLSMLDNSQIETLYNFTQGAQNFAKGLAQNVLCFYYDLCVEDNYNPGSGNRVIHSSENALSAISLNQFNGNNKAQISVSPNPASAIAVFSYTLPALNEQTKLTITDIAGKEIARFNLLNLFGQVNWDTGPTENGLYYYIKSGNTQIANGKISVKK